MQKRSATTASRWDGRRPNNTQHRRLGQPARLSPPLAQLCEGPTASPRLLLGRRRCSLARGTQALCKGGAESLACVLRKGTQKQPHLTVPLDGAPSHARRHRECGAISYWAHQPTRRNKCNKWLRTSKAAISEGLREPDDDGLSPLGRR